MPVAWCVRTVIKVCWLVFKLLALWFLSGYAAAQTAASPARSLPLSQLKSGLHYSGKDVQALQRIASDLLDGVRTLTIPWDLQRLSVGASIGIAAIGGSMSVDDAVAAADAQCYLAKAAGKNNVQVETPTMEGLDPLDVETTEGGEG